MWNLQEQNKKASCYQKMTLHLLDLKVFVNSRPSASNFKSFSPSFEKFFLTVGQNIFWQQNTIFSEFFKLFPSFATKRNFEMLITIFCEQQDFISINFYPIVAGCNLIISNALITSNLFFVKLMFLLYFIFAQTN